MVADYSHGGFGLPAFAKKAGEITAIVHGRSVHFDYYVAGAESRLLGVASLLNGTNQDAIAALHAKKLAKLWRQVFHHDAAAARRVDHNHRGNVDFRHVDL